MNIVKKAILAAVAVMSAAELRSEQVRIVCRDGAVVEVDAGSDTEMVAWAKGTLSPVVAEWYPKIARMLRSPGYAAPRRVTMKFVEGDGVAWTSNDEITLNTRWAKGELRGEAAGAVVHELVHVVQAYGRDGRKGPPGWMTEGVADWVRWMNFEKPAVRESVYAAAKGRPYDESYRTTAAFLAFCERKYGRGFVSKLNAAARDGTYGDGFWTKNCGGRSAAEVAAQWQADYGGAAKAASAATGKFDARPSWDAFVKVYWIPEKAQYRLHKGRDDKILEFWFAAHAWDAILDASRLFKDQKTKDMVPAFYDAFMKRNSDWTKNHFNDDILWWTIACTRAYSATKEKRYLDQARTMFDWLLEHEVDDTLGGGMWWKNSEHKSKNACNEFPAVITACNLYKITKERKYLTAAVDLYAWGRGALFDEKTGAVYDNMNLAKRVTKWNFSYNLGTFIGSGLRLYRTTGRREYLDDALKAAENLTVTSSPNGILKAGGQKGDGGAFNGIGVRYLAELAATKDGAKYRKWIADNAASARAHARRSDGIIGTDWTKTPSDDDDIEGQIANSSITLLLLAQVLSR